MTYRLDALENIIRTADGAYIPPDPENIDYVEYLAWLSQGNEPAPYEPPPPPVLTKIYKSDIWRRCSDAEADAIDALLNSQTVRLRRMWQDAVYLSTTDELFGLVQQGAVQLFGAARAGELLEPTE